LDRKKWNSSLCKFNSIAGTVCEEKEEEEELRLKTKEDT